MLLLPHVEVMLQTSANSHLRLGVSFPTTAALSQSNAWPVEGQSRALREFSSCRLTVPLCSFLRENGIR